MLKINVIGSCVCRDLFEFFPQGIIQCNSDYRFFSPASIISKNTLLALKQSDLKTVKKYKQYNSNWFRNNIIIDFNKTYGETLALKPSDFLIIDLADSRMRLLELSQNEKSCLVTFSDSFKKHYDRSIKRMFRNKTHSNIIDWWDISFDEWDQIIKEYVQFLLKFYKQNQVILIKTAASKEYLDEENRLLPFCSFDDLKTIYSSEVLFPKLCSFFVKYCPNCNVVEFPKIFIGDSRHKWGINPFHYDQLVYKHLANSILEIIDKNHVNQETSDNIEKALEEKCNSAKRNFLIKDSKMCAIDPNKINSVIKKRFLSYITCQKRTRK